MNGALAWFVAVLLVIIVLALIGIIFIMIRVRRIGRIVGTFECWVRPDASSGWVSGMARFGSHDLQWFRLVGFYIGPQFRLPREGLKVSNPISRNDGVVEVIVNSEDTRRHLAMRSEWYNGLVSWVESSAPKPHEDF